MSSIFRESLLEGKTAFITGGGSGIGQRMAERFAEHGAKVMLAGRKQDKLDRAAESIRSSGGIAEASAVDVRDYPGMEAALARTHGQFGEFDILVCGAAGNFPAPILGMSANAFKAVIDIDLLGTFNACRAAYAHLRKPGASIISISAGHATIPIAWQAHVCAAKAGVELFTRTLAIEWASAGVRANCVTPGATADTEGMRRLAPTDESRRKVEQSIPLGRFGSKDELADLALFLCSDSAAYITGAVYVCDGGLSLLRSGLSLTENQ